MRSKPYHFVNTIEFYSNPLFYSLFKKKHAKSLALCLAVLSILFYKMFSIRKTN